MPPLLTLHESQMFCLLKILCSKAKHFISLNRHLDKDMIVEKDKALIIT